MGSDTIPPSRRVLLVTNSPAPYRVPLFNVISREMKQRGVELRVVFGCAGYQRRQWNLDLSEADFSFKVLSDRPLLGEEGEKPVILYGGLWSELDGYRPHIVIASGFSFSTLKIAAWCRVRARPFVVWSGSSKNDPRNKGMARRLIRRALAKRAAAGIAYGTFAKEYLEFLGLHPNQVRIATNTVDVERIIEDVDQQPKSALLDRVATITFVGALSRRKNPIRVLEAVRELSMRRSGFVLEIIGDGTEMDTLRAFVRRHELSDMVRFEGHCDYDQLPRYLARSSCFLFQTDFDIWGLVLVEAMAAGVPCIASKWAGSTRDLVKDGETGFVVDFADPQEVVHKVEWILDHPRESERMAFRARELVRKEFSLAGSAKTFVRTVEQVLGTNGR